MLTRSIEQAESHGGTLVAGNAANIRHSPNHGGGKLLENQVARDSRSDLPVADPQPPPKGEPGRDSAREGEVGVVPIPGSLEHAGGSVGRARTPPACRACGRRPAAHGGRPGLMLPRWASSPGGGLVVGFRRRGRSRTGGRASYAAPGDAAPLPPVAQDGRGSPCESTRATSSRSGHGITRPAPSWTPDPDSTIPITAAGYP